MFALFFYRKPGLTGRGLYELKPECAKNFNLYFYHFSRAEQSKVTSSLTAWGLCCAFLFCLPFSKACFYEEVLPAGYLRMLTKFAQVFAVISVSLDPVPYKELLKSGGYSGACLWVPLDLTLLKAFKTICIFPCLYGNCHFSSNLPYSFMLGQESSLAQEERLILKLHALLYK